MCVDYKWFFRCTANPAQSLTPLLWFDGVVLFHPLAEDLIVLWCFDTFLKVQGNFYSFVDLFGAAYFRLLFSPNT